METASKYSTIQIELVEHVQRLQNRMNKLSRLPNNRHSLQAETSQQKTSQYQRENDATTLKRSGSKIQSAFVKAITHQKLSYESFKMGAIHKTMNWNQVTFSDETAIRLNCVKGLVWNLPEKKKIVQTVKRMQSKSMFQVASQVASSVLNKI